MSILSEFLNRNSVVPGDALPLVHSTRAYHLRRFCEDNKLIAAPCDVFTGDSLNYFFVGRPAYKHTSEVSESAYWEYPCCFIFDFKTVTDIKRVFPFDSGAFSRKLYPSYTRMMNLDHFDATDAQDAVKRIVGAFFGSADRYFKMKAKGQEEFVREYSLGAMDAELKALHRLSTERSASSFDDRRLSIEVSSSDVDLRDVHPLAVVAPSEYFGDEDFRRQVTQIWNAEPISYPIYSLSVSNSYGQIYEKVEEFY